MLEALIAAFETVEDPRCEWKVEHRLLDILVIAVCAVLGEAESFEDIAQDGRCKREWLEGFLELPNGIGSVSFRAKMPRQYINLGNPPAMPGRQQKFDIFGGPS